MPSRAQALAHDRHEHDEGQRDAVAEYHQLQRQLAQVGGDDVVEIQFLLVIGLEEIFGRAITDDALAPGYFFQRDEQAESGQREQEPSVHQLERRRESFAQVREGSREKCPEARPFQVLVFLDSQIIQVLVEGQNCPRIDADGDDQAVRDDPGSDAYLVTMFQWTNV